MGELEQSFLDYNSLDQSSLIKSLLRFLIFFHPTNETPLVFLRKEKKISLCQSIIQKRLLQEKDWQEESVSLIWQELLGLRWLAFKKAWENRKWGKEFILRLEAYTVYLQKKMALKKAYLREKTLEISTFELGLTGYGVSQFTKKEGIKSVFIQHGFLERSLSPLVFNELYLWTDHERKFFSIKNQGEMILRFTERRKEDLPKEVLLLTLEYPNVDFSLEKMKKIWKEFTPVIKKKFKKIIIREHPRIQNELKDILPFEKDPYQKMSLETSVLKNKAGSMISLSSASLVEAYYMGCDCYYLTDSAFNQVNFNYTKFFTKLT